MWPRATNNKIMNYGEVRTHDLLLDGPHAVPLDHTVCGILMAKDVVYQYIVLWCVWPVATNHHSVACSHRLFQCGL